MAVLCDSLVLEIVSKSVMTRGCPLCLPRPGFDSRSGTSLAAARPRVVGRPLHVGPDVIAGVRGIRVAQGRGIVGVCRGTCGVHLVGFDVSLTGGSVAMDANADRDLGLSWGQGTAFRTAASLIS